MTEFIYLILLPFTRGEIAAKAAAKRCDCSRKKGIKSNFNGLEGLMQNYTQKQNKINGVWGHFCVCLGPLV